VWHKAIMSSVQRIIGSAGLTVILGLLALGLGVQAGAQSVPMEVTSDTPAYCVRLLGEVTDLVRAAAVPPPPEVIRLSADGQRMCDEGQTRGGIMRLRRAWVLMAHPDGLADQSPRP